MEPLTAAEYRAVLARLGLTHERAGPMLGLTGRTSRRYGNGSSPVPERSVRLLYLLLLEQERQRAD